MTAGKRPEVTDAPSEHVEAEVVAVPVRQAASVGAFTGLVVGAVLGSLLGAMLTWLAGALLDWQRDLAFTLGIARRLLPFGDQVSLLRSVDAMWYFVIPGVALVLGLVAALFGALLAALIAGVYNRSRQRLTVRIRIKPGRD
jgi:hypothetical protein